MKERYVLSRLKKFCLSFETAKLVDYINDYDKLVSLFHFERGKFAVGEKRSNDSVPVWRLADDNKSWGWHLVYSLRESLAAVIEPTVEMEVGRLKLTVRPGMDQHVSRLTAQFEFVWDRRHHRFWTKDEETVALARGVMSGKTPAMPLLDKLLEIAAKRNKAIIEQAFAAY